MRRIAELGRLTPGERRTLLRAWALLLLAPFLLRFVSLPRLLVCRRAGAPVAPLGIERVAWLVSVAARYTPAARCLAVAVVTARLLARQGTPATLRIGVARHAGRFTAHAWLERDGRSLGIGGEGYVPIVAVGVGPA